jgi:hypothetical protein
MLPTIFIPPSGVADAEARVGKLRLTIQEIEAQLAVGRKDGCTDHAYIAWRKKILLARVHRVREKAMLGAWLREKRERLIIVMAGVRQRYDPGKAADLLAAALVVMVAHREELTQEEHLVSLDVRAWLKDRV